MDDVLRTLNALLPVARSGAWSVRDVGGVKTLFEEEFNWAPVETQEVSSQWSGISEAHKRGGHVLMGGLGTGLFPTCVLQAPGVQRVTVVERSPDVLKLTAGPLQRLHGDRLRIVHADVWEWEPDCRFTVGYFDIWPMKAVRRPEAEVLMARYAAHCEWMDYWRGF